jgi:DNA helicase IV
MSLIMCPECKNQISDKAEICPHCGLPHTYIPEKLNDTMSVKESAAVYNVAKKEITEYNKSIPFFSNRHTYIPRSETKSFYEKYNNKSITLVELYKNVETFNDELISRQLIEYKSFFDDLFVKVDPNIVLDEEQRRAILTDEDYCLVVAGAGAGKTTTMAAKVKYLVEKKNISPNDIVMISYTNKAINELKERINKKLGIPVKISTFHAFGYEILKSTKESVPKVDIRAYTILFEYINKRVFGNKRLMRNLVLFLGYYFDLPKDVFNFNSLNEYSTYKANLDYETLKSRLGEYIHNVAKDRSRRNRTIEGEFLRSMQEVQIANFLYLNNLEYEYEKPYTKLIPGSKKKYTPDFFISQGENECYLEHFGISENFNHALYNGEQLDKYKKAIAYKRKLHKECGTKLIQTWAQYNDERPLIEHLEEELKKQGFILTERDHDTVYRKLVETGKDKYVYKLIVFLIRFIENFKTCGYTAESFDILRSKTKNVRTNMFLDIAQEVYNYYQNELKKSNSIDFADMINDAEIILKKIKNLENKPVYKYIIIDEFQDIARQRFNLTKTLADVSGAKVVAVGDDWQSIFAFAGSDITLFQKFIELLGDGKELFISHTYRNSQELIDIAGSFIQKNSTQIKKQLISPKRIQAPIVVSCYDNQKDARKNWVRTITDTIDSIVSEHGESTDILLIVRYNFDASNLLNSDFFVQENEYKITYKKYPKVRIEIMTVHSSKGLGYDNVIVLNMIEAKYGFPAQIEDDPIIKLVVVDDDSYIHAEERRLFYVALTRTKNKAFLITPLKQPSQFVMEIVKDYKIKHDKNMEYNPPGFNQIKCPICGFPMKYENNKNYGVSLYMCTNEPEVCDFMTNDKTKPCDIYKCPKCSDGYMIVRENKKDKSKFYGCTNYSLKENQCSHSENIN